MSIKIYWGNLLRTLRTEKHLTQDEIAHLLHVKRQDYSYMECGKVHPKPEHLAILSNVYDLDLYRYALKCMPADYVEEQREFKTYINSAGIASERKLLRKARKEGKEWKEEIRRKETGKAKNPKARKRVMPVDNTNIKETLNAIEAEDQIFDRIINEEHGNKFDR